MRLNAKVAYSLFPSSCDFLLPLFPLVIFFSLSLSLFLFLFFFPSLLSLSLYIYCLSVISRRCMGVLGPEIVGVMPAVMEWLCWVCWPPEGPRSKRTNLQQRMFICHELGNVCRCWLLCGLVEHALGLLRPWKYIAVPASLGSRMMPYAPKSDWNPKIPCLQSQHVSSPAGSTGKACFGLQGRECVDPNRLAVSSM